MSSFNKLVDAVHQTRATDHVRILQHQWMPSPSPCDCWAFISLHFCFIVYFSDWVYYIILGFM
jgi:hypothetical protein